MENNKPKLSVFDKLGYFFNTDNIIKLYDKENLKYVKLKNRNLNRTNIQDDSVIGGLYGARRTLQNPWSNKGPSNESNLLFNNKLIRYGEYELMDDDSLIAGVLDVYSEDATTYNTAGEILKIKATDERIVDVLTNLFYDILKIEFNLTDWVRQLVKYGDFFLYLTIDSEYGIVGYQPLLPHNIDIRIEYNEKTHKDELVYYYVQSSTAYQYNFGKTKDEKFEKYELIHFKFKQDELFYPFSKSLLEAGRRTWTEIKLLEDAMLVYNITRAPSKRGFFINVGNLPPKDVDAFMEKIIKSVKRDEIIDQDGKINLRYNIENILDDYFIPVRGSSDSSRIETIDGGSEYNIEPLNYLQNKLLASFKVPKAYLTMEEDLSGKSTLAGEDIRFARSIRSVQKMVIDQLTKIAMIHLYVQGFKMSELLDFKLELTNPSTIHEKQQLELLGEKFDQITKVIDTNIVSKQWAYENILDLSEDEIDVMQEQLLHDAHFRWKLEQYEQNGKLEEEEEETSEDEIENAMGEFGDEESEETTEKESEETTEKEPEETTEKESEPTKEEGIKLAYKKEKPKKIIKKKRKKSSIPDFKDDSINYNSNTFAGNNPTTTFEQNLKQYVNKILSNNGTTIKKSFYNQNKKDYITELKNIFDGLDKLNEIDEKNQDE